MKKIKFLAALVIAISMLFVVAVAADIEVNDVEYNGTDSTITVTVKASSALEIDSFSNFVMTYDSAVFSVSSATSSDAAATINTAVAGKITWSNPAAATNTAVGDKILEVVFNVIAADKTDAYEKQFVISDGNNTTMWTPTDSADYNGTITVKEAKKPVENTIEPETDVIIDNTQYMGTAVYAQEFDLKAIDTTKAYGIKVGDETVVSTISGDGIVNYVLAYFGVADVDAIGTVQSFWTAK